jgi:thioredoxin reductase
MSEANVFECAIAGGGAAGLSAALVLGRARRRVLLVDAGAQSNRAAPHVGGLFGHDGTPPDVLYRLARQQLAPYGSVEVRDGEVAAARQAEEGFELELGAGATVRARRLLLATGMDYEIPDLPGAAELWGDTVFHCPFCHGWEVRDRPLAVLGNGGEGAYRALLLRGWSDDVVLLTDGPADLPDAARMALTAAGVGVVERRIARLADCSAHGGCGRHLDGVVFEDGSELPREGLLVPAPLRQRSSLATALGAALTDRGTVEVDDHGQTAVPGLYAAGDIAAPIQQVAGAAAAGAAAAAWIVHDLVASDHGIPLPAPPAPARP